MLLALAEEGLQVLRATQVSVRGSVVSQDHVGRAGIGGVGPHAVLKDHGILARRRRSGRRGRSRGRRCHCGWRLGGRGGRCGCSRRRRRVRPCRRRRGRRAGGSWRGCPLAPLPAVVEDVEQLDELAGGLLAAGGGGVAVPGIAAIGGEVVGHVLDVLHRAVPPAVVVAGLPAQVIGVGIAAVGGQDVVEVENGHVVVGIAVQPVVPQPAIEGPGVGGALRCSLTLHQGRRGDDHEQLVLVGGEVGQDVVVDGFRVGHSVLVIVRLRERRVVRMAVQIRVGKARFEHDDLVLTTGIGWQARPGAEIANVLAVLVIQGGQNLVAVGAGEPFGPVGDVRPVTDTVRPPLVVGGADKIVVVHQRHAQAAIRLILVWVGQPVPASGVVDEDELDGGSRRVGVVGNQPAPRGGYGRAGGQEQGQRAHKCHYRRYPSGLHFTPSLFWIGTN